MEEQIPGTPVPVEAELVVEEEMTLDGPIVLDLTDVKDTPVATGWHDFAIVESEAQKPEGRPLQIYMRADITNESDPDRGRPIFLRLPLEPSEQGDFRGQTRKFLKALGYDADSVKNYPTAQALADEFLDAELQMRVKHKPDKTDKDVVYANINGWKPLEIAAEDEIPF